MTLEEFKEYKNRSKCFYTKEEIQEILNNISQKVVVDTLPDEGQENYLYLIPSIANPGTYEQYIWKNNNWEYLGNVDEAQYVDYVTNPEMDLAFEDLKTINNQSLLGGGNLTILEEELPNKTYDPTNFSGLGRKYLQKNIVSDKNVLTQAMMNDANTIYVIQYDYDLNGQTVNVLAKTTLKFEGGSIKNGTLNFGKGVLVESEDVKIFDDVLFTGDCGGQYFHIDWFVANYAQTIADTEPDATEEIQAMFDCGIKRVWLTNKHHYHITDTIVVDASISIDGVSQQSSHNSANQYIFGRLSVPLIKFQAVGRVNNALVNNLYLYRLMDSSLVNNDNDFMKDTSTFYVDCTQGSIWGLKSNVILDYSEFKTDLYPLDGTTVINTYAMGFTGIEVYCASNNFITFADFSGYVYGYYSSIYVHKDNSSSWVTGITINYDSVCIFGGEINSNVVLNGRHQTNKKLPYNDYGYFDVKGNCAIKDCRVWDASQGQTKSNTTLFSTYYSIKAPKIFGGEEFFDTYSQNAINIKNNWLYPVSGNAYIGANILPAAYFGLAQGKTYNSLKSPITGFVYKYFSTDADYDDFMAGDRTKGTSLTQSNVEGFEYLFYPDRFFANNSTARTVRESRKARINAPIKALFLGVGASYFRNATIVVADNFDSSIESITIDNGSGEPIIFTTQLKNVPLSGATYNWRTYVGEIRVSIKYTTQVTNYALPYIGLCTYGQGDLIGANGGYVYGNLELNTCSVKQLNIKGLVDGSGTFSNKPSSPYVGFAYFCTDKQTTEGATDGIVIYHKGSNVWVDALGRTIS